MNKKQFIPKWKTHPGEAVKELFESRNASMLNFCKEMKVPYTYLLSVVHGKDKIVPALAQALGTYFETDSFMWLNLQKIYDKWQ